MGIVNFRTRGWSTQVAAFVTLIAAGCSSGTGKGGGGGFSTSVPAGTKLTALTPAQAQQLCHDVDAYDQQVLGTALCKQTGLEAAVLLAAFSSSPPADADLQAACAQAYEACLHPDGGATTASSTCDPTAVMSQPSTCQANVGDFTACVNDLDTAFQQSSASIPDCSSVTAATVASYTSSADAGTTSTTEPVSCSKFSSTCNSM